MNTMTLIIDVLAVSIMSLMVIAIVLLVSVAYTAWWLFNLPMNIIRWCRG